MCLPGGGQIIHDDYVYSALLGLDKTFSQSVYPFYWLTDFQSGLLFFQGFFLGGNSKPHGSFN